MALIIGSWALWGHGFKREPNDLDLMAYPDELKWVVETWKPEKVSILDDRHLVLSDCRLKGLATRHPIVEVELVWPGSVEEEIVSPEFKHWFEIADLSTLYSLKMSHRYKKNSPHFEKTRRDILDMRARDPHLLPWFSRRETETYDYSHPSLQPGQTKDNFFTGDGVKYFFDHDWVHTIVANMYGASVPAYQLYLKDGEAVACDRGKFDGLPRQERIRGVCEETTVLALERSQIPRKMDAQFGNPSPEWSFKFALQKVCTSITSGWFREFAWENYDECLRVHVPNYTEQFWEAVSNNPSREV